KLVCTLILCAGLTGCGTPADRVTKDEIKLMNEYADAKENRAPASQVQELEKQLVENERKFRELNVSEEEKRRLSEKYKNDVAKAWERMVGVNFTNMGNQLGEFKRFLPAAGTPA